MEKLPQLKYSCCGCNLRKGTKIIGWLCLILYMLTVILEITQIAGCLDTEETKGKKISSLIKRNSMVILIFAIVLVIIKFVLLLGVYMKKIKFIEAYLIASFALLIVAFILLLDNHVNWIAYTRALLSLYLVFHTYFLLVVHSYYRTIKDPESYPSSV